ncbi:MAG TPA: porin [Phycisphaerales bacterium]|nr:porin [Phycisphaerales bacterium]HMP36999.1 porin [Phycisphaerales bacterium]
MRLATPARADSLRLSAAIAATALAGSAPAVDATGADLHRVHAEIDLLRAEIAEYRRLVEAPGAELLDAARAAAIRHLADEALADAGGRASLQGSGLTAGWNRGFFLASADGNFSLKLRGYTQIRWVLNHRSDPPRGQDGTQSGFEIRRSYIQLDGHVVDPSWVYRVQANVLRDTGVLTLRDAYIRKTFDGGFFVQAGQAKAPFMCETLASGSGLLLVDRSLIDATFGIGRSQGVFVGWSNDRFRLTGLACDGSERAGGVNVPWNETRTEYAFAGRAEVKFGAGDWSQFNDMTSRPDEAPASLIGAAVFWQRTASGPAAAGVETLSWTVDGEVGLGGAVLFAAVVGRHLDEPGASRDQIGAYGQVGWYLLPTLEAFARYEWADGDTGADDLSIATLGATWYIAPRALKLSADVGYGLNAVAPLFGSAGGGAGWRTDALGDDGQIVVRVQMQFAY